MPDYILDQNATRAVRLGRHGSDYCGCGWIAAYNLLLAVGKSPERGNVIAAFAEKGLICRGLWGTNPFFFGRWLRKQGLTVRFCFSKRRFLRRTGEFAAAAVLYFHRRGAHYIALQPQSDGTLHIFNDRPGDAADFRTPARLLKQIRPFCVFWLIS